MAVYKDKLTEFAIKHLAGTISEEEQQELNLILNESPQLRDEFNKMSNYDWVSEELTQLYSLEIDIDWEKVKRDYYKNNL